MVTELGNLLLLNACNVVASILNLLTLLLALFHVVKLHLLPNLAVLRDLRLHSVLVAKECLLLLLVDFAFALLIFFLALNDTQEVVALSLRLLGQLVLFIAELPQASLLKVLLDASSLLGVSLVFGANLTVLGFASTLSSQVVDLALTVICLLLQLTETLDFLLLFGGETNSLLDLLTLNKILCSLVVNDLLFKDFLLVSPHSFDLNVLRVASFYLSQKFLNAFGLHLFLTGFGNLVFFYVSKQKLALLSEIVLMPLASLFALLNLVDDLERASLGSDLALVLAVGLSLQVLESLDFHHEIEAFLFFNPFLFELLVFFKLLITDCNNFGVEHHRIHLLHVVFALINLSLRLRQKCLVFGLVFRIKGGCGNSIGAGAVQLLHTLLALVGLKSLLLFLFGTESMLSNSLLFRHYLSAGANSIKVLLADDSTVLANASAGTFNAASGFAHLDRRGGVDAAGVYFLDGLVVKAGVVVELLGGGGFD
jgi:hypothetical protein